MIDLDRLFGEREPLAPSDWPHWPQAGATTSVIWGQQESRIGAASSPIGPIGPIGPIENGMSGNDANPGTVSAWFEITTAAAGRVRFALDFPAAAFDGLAVLEAFERWHGPPVGAGVRSVLRAQEAQTASGGSESRLTPNDEGNPAEVSGSFQVIDFTDAKGREAPLGCGL